MTQRLDLKEFGLWGKLRRARSPLLFDLELTACCNLDCRHCYINVPAGDRAAREAALTTGEILSVAGEAARLGALWCLLTGGEPLLRPDFAEIYLGLRRLGLLVSVFTNATLIDDQSAALFRKHPPRDIEVTVYGVTAETYERVTRRPGSFARFRRGLDLLLNGGVRVRLKSMALQSNLHEQRAIAEFCRARTKDFYRFDPQLHLRFDGDAARNSEIRSERLTPEQVTLLECEDEERFSALHERCDTLVTSEPGHLQCDHLFHCGAGLASFTVGYDGRFRLCSSLCAEGTTYDLRTGTLADAWHNFVPRVRDLRSRRAEYLASCRNCALINLCSWCPGNAHLETNLLDGATPYFCAVAHHRAESLRPGSSAGREAADLRSPNEAPAPP